MSTQQRLLDILKTVGAIITDSHIVGTSGKHMSVYINKDALYPHTQFASEVGKMFAEKYKLDNIEAVVSPALGGIVLSQWTAYHLSQITNKEVLGIYTEKDEDKNQIFKRGYDKLIQNKRVLVIEDITNTGGSVKKVIESVKNAGGEVAAVGVMVNRDEENITSDFIGAPFSALAIVKAQAWDEKDCQLCRQDVPVNTSVGHGKEFLEKTQKTSSKV